MISFDGLQESYRANRCAILSVVDEVLDEGKRHRCRFVKEFEEISRPSEDYYSLGVTSGTAGLEICLRALDIKFHHNVIVPAFSFAATSGAVISAGGQPLFCDVSDTDPFLDISALDTLINDNTLAIIPAHLYGARRDTQSLLEICRARGIALIEDAAQLAGVFKPPPGLRAADKYAAVLSFDPYKVMPGLTGGGLILTPSSVIASKIKLLKCHGYDPVTGDFLVAGTNIDISSIDAAVLTLETKRFPADNAARYGIAKAYNEAAKANPYIEVVTKPDKAPSNFHKFVLDVNSASRTKLAQHLGESGIPSKVHYAKALPDYPAFAAWAALDYPHARSFAGRVLSLPIYPTLSAKDRDAVCKALESFRP